LDLQLLLPLYTIESINTTYAICADWKGRSDLPRPSIRHKKEANLASNS
jgi:hypothetical protein